MIKIEPINQKKLFGLEKYIKELIQLDKKKFYPIKFYLVVKRDQASQH